MRDPRSLHQGEKPGAAAPTSRRRPGAFTEARIELFGSGTRCLSRTEEFDSGQKNNGPGEASRAKVKPRRSAAAGWSRDTARPRIIASDSHLHTIGCGQ